MLVVYVPVGFPARQFEMPKTVSDRSVKGAIHLRPNSTKTLTQAELDEIKKQEPRLGRRLVVTAGEKLTKASKDKSEVLASERAKEAERVAKKAEAEKKAAEEQAAAEEKKAAEAAAKKKAAAEASAKKAAEKEGK